jgi:RNA polymerase sigma factor (sigma-70 family)
MRLAPKLHQLEQLNRGFSLLQSGSKNKAIAHGAILRILAVIREFRQSFARVCIVLATIAAGPVFSTSAVPGDECDFGKVSTAVTVDDVYQHTRIALATLNIPPSDWDDIMQEVMIKYLTKGHQFEGRNDAKLSSWLFSVTRNVSASSYRKRREKTTLDMSEDDEDSPAKRVESKSPRPDRAVELDEYSHRVVPFIRQAIRELPIERREVFLALATGIRQEEVAQKLKVDFGTVKSRLYRTAGQLKEKLNHLGVKGIHPDLKASDIAELEVWKVKDFSSKRIPETADDVLGQMPPVTRDILALHLLFDLPPASIGKIMGQKTKQITRYLEDMKLRLAEQASAHGIKLPDEWRLAPVHYSNLEDTVGAIRKPQERELVSRVLLKGAELLGAARELGIEEHKAREIFARNLSAIRRRTRLFKIEDPRLNPYEDKKTGVRTLEQAIAALPKQYQPILQAKLVDGLYGNVDAISKKTGLSKAAVNAKTQKAKKLLVRLLEQNQIIDPRSAHIYSPPAKTLAEAIWKVDPIHQPILKLLHLQLLQAEQIRQLPEYKDSKTFARDLKRAEQALTKVLEEHGLERKTQESKLARILKRRTERQNHLDALTANLDSVAKDAFHRFEMGSQSIDQIADALNLSPQQVALLISDTRLALFAELKDPKHLRRKIALLPEKNRKIAELALIEKKSIPEIAQEIGYKAKPESLQPSIRQSERGLQVINTLLPQFIQDIEDTRIQRIAQLTWLDGYPIERVAELTATSDAEVKATLRQLELQMDFEYALDLTRAGDSNFATPPFSLTTEVGRDFSRTLPNYEVQVLEAAKRKATDLDPDSEAYARVFQDARLERETARKALEQQITHDVPEKYRAAARLFVLEGLSRPEVVVRLGITPPMAKVWKRKILEFLKQEDAEDSSDPARPNSQ